MQLVCALFTTEHKNYTIITVQATASYSKKTKGVRDLTDKAYRIHSGRRRKNWSVYLFLLPGFCLFCFSVLIPFLRGIHIAFTDWNGITTDYHSVGLRNFISIFQDQRVKQPLLNSLKFACIGTVGSSLVSLGSALLVNQWKGRLGNLFRSAFFIPVCFSSILTAFIWGFLYREALPHLLGIKNMLGNRDLVIPAIVIMGIWNTSGINMLIYLSGLKNIPGEILEAAKIDGASAWKQFTHVTLPLLTPSFTVCVTLSMTSWLKEFAMTMAATGGGPAGASKTMTIYIFENLYTYNKAGYGQAIAIAFALLLILLGNSVSSFFRKREVEL